MEINPAFYIALLQTCNWILLENWDTKFYIHIFLMWFLCGKHIPEKNSFHFVWEITLSSKFFTCKL